MVNQNLQDLISIRVKLTADDKPDLLFPSIRQAAIQMNVDARLVHRLINRIPFSKYDRKGASGEHLGYQWNKYER